MATGMKSASKNKRSDIHHIPVDAIQIKEGWNVRELDTPDNKAALQELADSILAVGVKQPLTGYFEAGTVYLTDGHRRLAATKLAIAKGAPILTLPVQSEPRGVGEAERVSSMLVRNSGLPLTPFEQSKAVKRLIDYGWSTKQVADVIGKTGSYVNQLLYLQAAPESVKALVREGAVSAATAVKTVKQEGGAELLRKAAQEAKEAGRRKVTPKAVQAAQSKTSWPTSEAVSDDSIARTEALLAAAALLVYEALPARYATPPAIWPFSNASWYHNLEKDVRVARDGFLKAADGVSP